MSPLLEMTAFPGTFPGSLLEPGGGADIKYEEVGLVLFILLLWAVVLRIFFQRWGNNENFLMNLLQSRLWQIMLMCSMDICNI